MNNASALVEPQAGEEIRAWSEQGPEALGPASSFQPGTSLTP